jgi:hypothetical protein
MKRGWTLAQALGIEPISTHRFKHVLGASGFKGISFSKAAGKWEASINIDGKKKYLGLYASSELAAAAYDAAAIAYFGRSAITNTVLLAKA